MLCLLAAVPASGGWRQVGWVGASSAAATTGRILHLSPGGFTNLRAWTHGVDTGLFAYAPQAVACRSLGLLQRPVALFVGRVSYEKNIEAFLRLDLPGTKVVCGVGPLEASLRARHPQVHWVGVLPRAELAQVYAAADVFVFPSRADTFGLVMLEAMACGTPVAAYPEDGPLEVLAARRQGGHQRLGGAINADLRVACHEALRVPRHEARARAMDFSWEEATRRFVDFLVPCRGEQGANTKVTVTPLSSQP